MLPRSSGLYLGGEEFGSPVTVDGDGRILIVDSGAIRRLLPDGSVDPSFGTDGRARVAFGSELTDVTSVAVLPDGEILAGGGAESECSDSRCIETPALARLTEDGSPDPAFGDAGHEILTGKYRGEEPRVMGLAVGPRGEIYAVSGGYPPELTIQRLDRDGELNRSFGRGGSLIVGQAGPARSGLFALPKIAVTPTRKLVVGGDVELHGGTDAMVAFRYLADGNPDPSFGQNGHAVLKTSVNGFTNAIAVLPSGAVVLSGDGVGKTKSYFLVAALHPDGSLDSTVGHGGFAKVKVASESSAQALVLQSKTAIAIGYTANPATEVRRTLLARVPLSR